MSRTILEVSEFLFRPLVLYPVWIIYYHHILDPYISGYAHSPFSILNWNLFTRSEYKNNQLFFFLSRLAGLGFVMIFYQTHSYIVHYVIKLKLKLILKLFRWSLISDTPRPGRAKIKSTKIFKIIFSVIFPTWYHVLPYCALCAPCSLHVSCNFIISLDYHAYPEYWISGIRGRVPFDSLFFFHCSFDGISNFFN